MARTAQSIMQQVQDAFPDKATANELIIAKLAACPIKSGMRVLEIGTGTGFQAAILKELGADLTCIEIDGEKANIASRRLGQNVLCQDGRKGAVEQGPFDAIWINADIKSLEKAWQDQLKPKGKIVTGMDGHLTVFTKGAAFLQRQTLQKLKLDPLICRK